MNVSAIHTLYTYNDWANTRILDQAARLPAEQLNAPSAHGPSLRQILVHTLVAEHLWLRRWQGESPTAAPQADEFPDIPTLRARWRDEQARLDSYLATLTDDALAAVLTYRNTRGQQYSDPLWQLLLHVVNHGTQHRAEAAAILTAYDHSPGDIDFTIYLHQQP